MIVFNIFWGILAGLSIGLGIKSEDKKKEVKLYVLGSCLLVLSLLPLVEVVNAPKALDVYKEKTELKIDGYYKDNVFIATDSTVVWKED